MFGDELLDVRAGRTDLQSLLPGLVEGVLHHDPGEALAAELRVGDGVVEVPQVAVLRVVGVGREVVAR